MLTELRSWSLRAEMPNFRDGNFMVIAFGLSSRIVDKRGKSLK